MIPLLLHSHTRALTKVQYNRDGDLLFSASKDDKPVVWRTASGERLGTYNGHRGAVWALDVSSDSAVLASGSADNTAIVWDVCTGRARARIETDTGVRSVAWAMGDQLLAVLTDATMGFASAVLIWDARMGAVASRVVPALAAPGEDGALVPGKKATAVRWTDCNDALLTGHDDGCVALWAPRGRDERGTPELLAAARPHGDSVRDLQLSRDRTAFVTASRDTTAKLHETSNLRTVKTYATERPVNSASLSPIRPEVVVAGGQEALHVTTTSSHSGHFEARFFHAVLEAEVGTVRGHFGPINTLAYAPDGRGYASGAEDGYVRLHTFDADYYDFAFADAGAEEPLL